MFKHGILLRASYSVVSRRYFSSIISQSNPTLRLNFREYSLDRQFVPLVRHYSKAAVIENAATEHEKTFAESEVKGQVETANNVNYTANHTNVDNIAKDENISVESEVKERVESADKVSNVLGRMSVDNKASEEEEEDEFEDDSRKKWNNEQEKILYQEIEKGNLLSPEEWSDLRRRILEPTGYINETNVDSSIVGVCMYDKKLALGRSYLDYLTSMGKQPNVATISKFFKLCHQQAADVDEEVKLVILSIYDSLRERYPVLDAGTCETAAQALSLTSRWREGILLLDEIRLTCNPNTPTYSALVRAAFDNDEVDLGWELLEKTLQDNRKPAAFVYEAWLKLAHRVSTGDAAAEERMVDRLLHFVGDNDIRLSEEAVRVVRNWFEYCTPLESNWDAEFTTVDMRGQCKTCFRSLSSIALRQDEFEQLRTAFMERAVVGSDVFLKSTPEELAEFQEFVKQTAPYDIVIDGLNVGYSAGTGKGNPRSFGKMLQAVVKTFAQRGQKILVLGRRHMSRWPQEHMDYVHDNASVFLAENLSQDDPYLLYAAMYSGLGTAFISRDLMRSHLFLLKDARMQTFFRRWQKQHQYQVLHIGENGSVKMRQPLKFSTSTQRGKNGGWHVPYDLDTTTTRSQGLSPPYQWLCVRKREERHFQAREEGTHSRFQQRERDEGEERSFRPRYQSRDENWGERKPFRPRYQSRDEDYEGEQKPFRPRYQSWDEDQDGERKAFKPKYQPRDEDWGERKAFRPKNQSGDRDSLDKISNTERDTFDQLFDAQETDGKQRRPSHTGQHVQDDDDELDGAETPRRRLGHRSKISKDWSD